MTKTFEQAKVLCVIDGSALVYRAFYGIGNLSTSSGQETNAVYGFFKSLIKTLETFKSKELFLIVAWDSKSSSRKTVFNEYKSNRMAMPASLESQFAIIKQICTLCQIEQMQVDGLEADDLIGSCAGQSRLPVLIVSPDKDLLQLVNELVFVYDPSAEVLYDRQEVEKKYGLRPENLKLYFALLGDASDNIPGVAGIGKKSALEVAQKFTQPKEVLNNLNAISPKLAQKILADKQNLFLSFQLFSLIDDPLELDLSNKTPFDIKNLLLAEQEFQNLEIKTIFPKSLAKDLVQNKAIDQTFYNQLSIVDVTAPEQLEGLLAAKAIAIDTETTGLDWKTDKIQIITLSDGQNNFFIDVRDRKNMVVVHWIAQNLFNNRPEVTLVFHNGKFDLHFLGQLGISVGPGAKLFDTIIAAQILSWADPREKINLKSLARKHFKLNLPSYKELVDSGQELVNQDGQFSRIFKAYSSCDALLTFQLYQIFDQSLDCKQKSLFWNIEMPLVGILKAIESHGIAIDQARLQSILELVNKELEKVELKLRTMLEQEGYDQFQTINFLSPKQVGHLLFDFFMLNRFLPINSKPSTDKETLDYLSKFHPCPELISQLRGLAKLKSTYLEGFLKHVWTDGKVHTTYSQTNVATGRLASENPNLQNLPLDFDQNNERFFGYRSIFVPEPGKVLVSVDYSQIELRVLAHVTKDPILIKAFENNVDVHSATAAAIFNVSPEQVTAEQRQVGKRINFGIVYGLGAFGLAGQLEIPRGKAQEYIDTFFVKYSMVAQWIEQTIKSAHEHGFVETIFGRRRVLPEINDRNANLQKAGERMAVNCVIQGSAAEIVKIAMINVQEVIDKKFVSSGQILLQVHDELVFQVSSDREKEFTEEVCQAMERAVKLDIGLKVDVSSGPNLLDLK